MPIGARLGDFEVTGVIHQGRFGVVYLGADRSLLRKVAIREYFPARLADRMADGTVGVRSLRYQQSFRDGRQRFLGEARMLAALDEPALVKVLRFWEQHGTAYMAMPLYEGRTLENVLRDSPKPSEAWLKAMLGPSLDALATLHRSDRYPCDVTSDNIVVLSDGAPLLFDFGTARRIVASTTQDVTVVPNHGFAAIEQYAHDPSMPEGPWTDIYAVSAVLHLAITGKPPPSPTTRIVADTMLPLGEVTKDYSALFLDAVDRGLAVRPEHRPQTIAEFRAALGIPPIASGAIVMGHAAPLPPAPGSDARKVSRFPESGPIPRVGAHEGTRVRALGVGSKAPPPSPVPEQRSPIPPSQTTPGNRLSGAPWKRAVSLIVVGLAGLGLLVWTLGGPRQATPVTADNASTMKPVPTSAQPNPPVATSAPPTQTATPPVAPAPGAGPFTSVPGGTAASAASASPAARTGKIQFSIKPWGQILVDGKTRGVSPPIKELSIPEGRHWIEIRNGTFRGYAGAVDIKAGSRVSIAHSFKSP